MRILGIVFIILFIGQLQAQFVPGNLIINVIGNGSTTLNSSAYAPKLVEYDITGATTGTTVTLPSIASGLQRACTQSGTAISEGSLNLSVDGRYIVLTGYDAAEGTSSISSSTLNRVIARVDAFGTINTTTNFLATSGNAYSANNIRSAASVDGSAFWASGFGNSNTGGVRYITLGSNNSVGTQVSTTTTNTRYVNVVDNQLYVTSGSGTTKMATVGSGLPTTTGNFITNLPFASILDVPNSAYGFQFFDVDTLINGVDLLYVVAHGNGSGENGFYKYKFNGTNWISKDSIVINSHILGITGFVNCTGEVELYVLNSPNGASVANRLIKYVDVSGYNNNMTGAGTDFNTASTVIATAATNTGFKGICFAPTLNGGIITSPTATITPNFYNDIIIKSGGVATLTGDITIVRNLIIESGGTLKCNGFNVLGINGATCTLKSGGTLEITSLDGISYTSNTGNIQTCNKFFSNAANYVYNSSSINQVTGNALPTTVRDLTINNGVNLTLTNPCTVSNKLYLTSGTINTTATNLLTLNHSASLTPIVSTNGAIYSNFNPAIKTNFGNENSYIVGPLKINCTGSVNAAFPVGITGIFRPIFLNNAMGSFTVEHFTLSPRNTPYNNVLETITPLDHISDMEYWKIDAATTPSPTANVELTFYDPNSGGVTDLNELRVARFTGVAWKDEGNTAFIGTAGANGSVTSNSVTTYNQPFTLASSTNRNPLPVIHNITLRSTPSIGGYKLIWNVLADDYIKFYTVEYSTNKVQVLPIYNVISNQTNIASSYVTYMPNANQYYRIKAVLHSGAVQYSNWVYCGNGSSSISIYPNPAHGHIVVKVPKAAMLLVYNSLGMVVLRQTVVAGNNTVRTTALHNGNYIVKLIQDHTSVAYSTALLIQQ